MKLKKMVMCEGGEILLSPHNSEIERSVYTNKKYSDFLIDGVPIWEVEHRGMTEEEALAFKEEVESLGKDRCKVDEN